MLKTCEISDSSVAPSMFHDNSLKDSHKGQAHQQVEGKSQPNQAMA